MDSPSKSSVTNLLSPSTAHSSPAPALSLPLPPTAFPLEGLSEGGLAGPEPSTSATDAKKVIREDVERREFARIGVIVPGSGDGLGIGDECYLWTDVPNVKNFRYTPCALSETPSPHPSFPFYRTIPYPPPIPPVHFSLLDRSSYLRISPSLLTVYNEKGFRSCRTNVSVRSGTWYYEVLIDHGSGDRGSGKGGGGEAGNPHVRVGWGRREANFDTPVGCDAYSYAIRDVNGEKVHLSRPKAYANMPFKTGDIVGCLITLPPRPSLDDLPPDHHARIKRQRRPFNYKNQAYFESTEYTPIKEMDSLIDRDGRIAAAAAKAAVIAAQAGQENLGMGNGNDAPKGAKKGAATKNTKKGKKQAQLPLEPVARTLERLPASSISFTINGQSFGTAFEHLYDFSPLPSANQHAAHGHGKKNIDGDIQRDDGTLGYYPIISCFGRAKATANFGPKFAFPQSLPEGARAMSERWAEFREEERVLDELDEITDTKRLQAILEAEKKAASKNVNKGKGALSARKQGSHASGSATPSRPAKSSSNKKPNTTANTNAKRKRDARDGTDISTATPGPDGQGGSGNDSVRGLTATPVPPDMFGSDIGGVEWREGTRERSVSMAPSHLSYAWGPGDVNSEMENDEEEEVRLGVEEDEGGEGGVKRLTEGTEADSPRKDARIEQGAEEDSDEGENESIVW